MSELSRNEYIKEASDYLRGTLAEGLTDEITGAIVEDDQQLVKFHGMYLQDDRDLRGERARKKLEKAFAFMLRVRISGGVLTTKQWRALDWIARVYGNGTMRATTRQTIQLHGVIKSNLKATLKAIDEQLLEHHRGLRRREPQRDEQSEPVPVEGARGRARARARHLGPSDAAHRRLSRDLARRREDRGRRARGGRADLRQDLSAAEVQDRGGGAALERRRHLRARSRLHRDPRRRRQRHRLERDRRRRHGHDAWRARHLSARRRRDGLLRDARRDRGRGGGRHRAARLGRPHQPQARAAEIHHRGSRARRVPRRGGEARGRDARRAEAVHIHLDRRPLRLDRGRERQGASDALCRRTAASRTLAGGSRDADRPAQDRRDPQGRHAAHREPERDHRECLEGGARRRSRRS